MSEKLFKAWVGFVCMLAFCEPVEGQVWMQARLQNGLVFEGEVATFNEYSSALSVVNPWAANSQDRVVMVNDGIRRVFFHAGKLQQAVEIVDYKNPAFEIWQEKFPGSAADGYANQVLKIGKFDEFGHRDFIVNFSGQIEPFVQGITEITPRFVEVATLMGRDSGNKNWTMRLATSSIPSDILSTLMHRKIKEPSSPTEYWRIFEIFFLAKMYDLAHQELKLIEEKFPDQAQEVSDRRKEIRPKEAEQILNEIENRRDVGQPKLALQLASVIVTEDMGDETQIRFLDAQDSIKKSFDELTELRKVISETAKRYLETIPEAEQQEVLRQFLNEIEANLSIDNAKRFDGFVRLLGDQTLTDEKRVAQIISGWYLGSAQTLDNYAVAESLIPVYRLVREYLGSAPPTRRAQVLQELRKYEGGAPQYVAALIAQMPPVLPPDLSKYNGNEPLRYSVELPNFKAANTPPLKFSYSVLLPPEYDPYRKYPCLIVLPSLAPDSADRQLNLWCGDFNPKLGVREGFGPRNGYIVVGIDWRMDGQGAYGYSARENSLVLKTVRQCLRQFSIDSDRVFLEGIGIGAEAAYDIAVSHPDVFAGAVGISGGMEKYTEFYRENRHLGLAVYSVLGQKDIGTAKQSQKTWNTWLQTARFNDLIVVEYIGRPVEAYFEEIPRIFQWMARQKRKWPTLADDLEIDCKSLRPWDCQYWFFELLGMPESNIVPPEFWISTGYDPIKIQVTKKGNRFIKIGPSKLGSGAIISLSPEFVDFSKKIEIDGRGRFDDFVKPSLKTLLEDVRTRGDRQHPAWAKLIDTGRKWITDDDIGQN